MKKKHLADNKKRKSTNKTIVLLIIVLILSIFLLLLIPKTKESEKKQKKIENQLLGSWTTDDYTVYEFYENGSGALKIPIATYDFSYKIDNNNIYIDFKNETSIDSDYEFFFEDGKLILKGINKTSGTYTFKKVNNK